MSTAMTRPDFQNRVVTGYVLLALGLFGLCGVHRIYTGRWVSGLIWMFTGGLCGIGQLVDILFIPRMIEDQEQGRSVW